MKIKNYAILIVTLFLTIKCNNEKIKDFKPAAITEPYKDIFVIDIHNHDASAYQYKKNMYIWDKYRIDRIVLFGDISEPSALTTDQIAFDAYLENNDRIIPFIAGINIHDPSCLDYVREKFNLGVYGIGEIVAASTYSPVTSNLPWKAMHPMDGYLPEIYKICEEYNKPILLHLDPTIGLPIEKLEEAATKYPKTKFIFAHANAYNTPSNLEELLKKHDNIYIDFFAGFNAYNPESQHNLSDFIHLITAYPDKFMVSSDSGFDIGYDNAYSAIYELFDLLEEYVIKKIACENFLTLTSSNKEGF